MKIKILGSGTILSPENRNQAGYILQNNGVNFLIDIGSGILKQMITASIDPLTIKAIFISHFHADHCSDLLPFLLRRHLLQRGSNRQLKIFGPQGLKVWFAGQALFQGKWLNDYLPSLIEMDNREFVFSGLTVQAKLNGHTENSLSLLFKGEQILFYSSDTAFNRELIPIAAEAHTAIVECSLPDGVQAEGHLTPSTTGILAAEATVKKLIVSHIYPQNDTDDLKNKIAKYFAGEIIIAEDFLEIEW